MRRILFTLTVMIGASCTASQVHAQATQVPFTSINDPFFAYYAFYLPRQQAQALQPGPEATIATVTANRQAYAVTNSNEAFDRFSPGIGGDNGDFSPNSGLRRQPGSRNAARNGGNLNGQGPAGYFNTARSYHPALRNGISRNNNVAVLRGRAGGLGSGGGFGSVGLPGPR